jgi:hypothetical protein
LKFEDRGEIFRFGHLFWFFSPFLVALIGVTGAWVFKVWFFFFLKPRGLFLALDLSKMI